MYEEEKHLNYKRVILVIAIIILIISCIYIGIILPHLVNLNKENLQDKIEETENMESSRDKENIIQVELTPDLEPPSRENEETDNFLITPEEMDKIKSIYH